MYQIEITEVGPDGHTTFVFEARDRAHRDELSARLRAFLEEASITAAGRTASPVA